MVTVNIEEYYNAYKDIYKTCMKDGLIFPVKLIQIPLPLEYRFTEKEKKQIDGKITEKNLLKQKESYINRRQKDMELSRKYDDDFEGLEEVYEKEADKELKDFINKYPKYEKIIG